MENYRTETSNADELIQQQGQTWAAINPEYVARMRLQNRFRTGLDIARYTAKIMREDMESYDNDSANYTQSLGCWHGFVGQQKMISIKKHFETTRVPLPVPVWLDGRGTSFRIRSAARSIHARENHRPNVNRRAIHLPETSGCT